MALDQRYTIGQKLGEGGFGAVFRGTHKQMGTPVAIKVLHAQHASSLETVARFEQEARRSATLKHPNTIRVFDFGRDNDGSLFIVMELLDGAPLSQRIKEGRFSPERATHVLLQALAALDEAHQQGLVHRDLKPDNIFLTRLGKDPDFVKVLDFGIAKALDANAKLTASGVVIGTPTYMSPEQCRGAALDQRSDLYSLGCIAYQMLAGRPPFLADSVVGYIFAHVQEAPDLGKLGPGVPDGLVDWIARCLAKEPADRFATADEARDALLVSASPPLPERAVELTPLRAATAPAASDTARSAVGSTGRKAWPWPLLGGGVLALAGVVWAVVASTSEEPNPEGRSEPPAVVTEVVPAGERPSPLPAGELPTERVASGASSLADAVVPDAHPSPAAELVATPPEVAQTPPDAEIAPTETAVPEAPRVALSSVPTGASVRRGRDVVGKTPLELTWLIGDTTPFTVELKNYDPATLSVASLTGKSIHEVKLKRITAKSADDGVARTAVGSLERTEKVVEPSSMLPAVLSQASIMATLRRVPLASCVARLPTESFPMKLVARIVIQSSGRVQSVGFTRVENTTPSVESCVTHALMNVRFDSFTSPTITISYPVNFQ